MRRASLLDANLVALEVHDPDLARNLSPYRPSDRPCHGLTLASPSIPAGANVLMITLPDPETFTLLRRSGAATLFLFSLRPEPLLSFLAENDCQDLVANGSLQIYPGPACLPLADWLATHGWSLSVNSNTMFYPRQPEPRDRDYLLDVFRTIYDFLQRRKTQASSRPREEQALLGLRNAILSAGWIGQSRPITELAGKGAHHTALLVSAPGPLRVFLPQVARLAPQAYLFCLDICLPDLLNVGIRPDLVLAGSPSPLAIAPLLPFPSLPPLLFEAESHFLLPSLPWEGRWFYPTPSSFARLWGSAFNLETFFPRHLLPASVLWEVARRLGTRPVLLGAPGHPHPETAPLAGQDDHPLAIVESHRDFSCLLARLNGPIAKLDFRHPPRPQLPLPAQCRILTSRFRQMAEEARALSTTPGLAGESLTSRLRELSTHHRELELIDALVGEAASAWKREQQLAGLPFWTSEERTRHLAEHSRPYLRRLEEVSDFTASALQAALAAWS